MQLIPALKEQWLNLTAQYTTDEPLLLQEFDHLITHYSTITRFYHNLQHLHNLLLLQQQYAEEIKDHDTIGFAIFYHDLVYDVMKTDNEEESALAAVRFLQQTNVPVTQAEKIMDYIRATKSHDGNSPDNDLLLFLDFDMAILGSAPEEYQQYAQQIRMEYNSYNDTAYNMGRTKVLQHFLQMPHIYSTETFRNKYEQQARENINAELAALKTT